MRLSSKSSAAGFLLVAWFKSPSSARIANRTRTKETKEEQDELGHSICACLFDGVNKARTKEAKGEQNELGHGIVLVYHPQRGQDASDPERDDKLDLR